MTETEHARAGEQSVLTLHGVGNKFAEQLSKIGLLTLQDLLFHLPLRYVDRTTVRPIASLSLNQTSLVEVRVLTAQIRMGKRRSLQVSVEDDSGELALRFFHFSAAQKNALTPGRQLRVFGELRPGPGGMEMYHPEYEFLDSENTAKTPEQCLTPIYPSTDGISQQRIRKLVTQVVDQLDEDFLEELLPEQANESFAVSSLAAALKFLHQPPIDSNLHELEEGSHPCQQRLAFEELLAHFLTHQQIRIEAKRFHAPAIELDADTLDPFLSTLPFSPTGAQQRVFHEIHEDIRRSDPMLRLVQGDVGSGKTLVAAMAAFIAVKAGQQVALVAPTEILAEQHYANLSAWLNPLGVRCDMLIGKMTPKQKRECLQRLEQHESELIIGTHALFQDKVMFATLGLVVIDELKP